MTLRGTHITPTRKPRQVIFDGSVPLNPNLFTNPIPILNFDTYRSRRTVASSPLTSYNSALYTITISAMPFSQVGIPPAVPIRLSPIDFYNLVLLSTTTAVPFNQTDFAVTFRPRAALTPQSTFNPNLFTNAFPFNQYSHPAAHTTPRTPVDLSRALNLAIFTNPIPILNIIYTLPHHPLPTLLDRSIGFQIQTQPIVTATLIQRTLTGVGL